MIQKTNMKGSTITVQLVILYGLKIKKEVITLYHEGS